MEERKSPPRSLTIGSAMVDIIAIIADRDVERVTLHNATISFLLVEQGRKIEAESISTHVGGGGVNVAVALRRLERPVDALIKLGRDVEADRVRDHLKSADIGTGLVIASESLPTGSAVLIASHDRDAAIYTQRGANTALTPAEIKSVDLRPYGLVYISPLSDASADCFSVAVTRASEAGAFTVANPGIRQITTRSPDLLHALGQLDLLVINAKEAAALAPALMAFAGNCPSPLRSGPTEGGQTLSLLKNGLRLNDGTFPFDWFLKTMASCGARRVAVTNGREGSYLYCGGDLLHCPVRPVAVKGTAGAGDAFCATLAHGLSVGLAARQALSQAAVNAASVVGHTDTQSGLLDQAALARETLAAGLSISQVRL
jgi:sugar/nucleoside kinase (ribokinase family)